MAENIFVSVFDVESEGYQAFTELKQNPGDKTSYLSQIALTKKEDGAIKVLDSFDTGAATMNDTAIGGLVGACVGIIGGPIGVLLLGSYGALVGSVLDGADAVDQASMIEQIAGKMQDGDVVIVGLAATAVNVIIASMGAYCISRFRFKGREKIFTLFTAGILVPLNALMVPYFVIINKLGLYNTYGGMILLYCAIGIPMSTFLIRGLMDSIPMELEEAAYIDGCGFFGRFFYLILPLSRTGIVTAATFEFLTCWNEFVFANLIVSSEKLRTIQVGIRYFTNQFSTDYVSMYAAIVISIIPSILGYILFQEQIIAGMTSGAVKA